MERKAVVLGATGLIGNELVELLATHKRYAEIRIIGRKNTPVPSSKIKFYQTDMEQLASQQELFNVNDIFCCLGTTMKTAGSKEAFRKVDYQMVADAALNSEGRVEQFLMISSLGASLKTSNFYLKTKGEVEAFICSKNIPSIHILRPSILFGNRKESRTGEKIGIAFMKTMGPLMLGSLKKFRGNEAKNVANAMIHYALLEQKGIFIHESRELEISGKLAS